MKAALIGRVQNGGMGRMVEANVQPETRRRRRRCERRSLVHRPASVSFQRADFPQLPRRPGLSRSRGESAGGRRTS